MLLNSTTAVTEASASFLGFENIPSNYLIIISLVFFVTLLTAALVTLKALKLLTRLTMPELETQRMAGVKTKEVLKVERKQKWNRILGLNDLETEEEIMIDHEYDGIRELDNPILLWFNALFYSSILFAVGYLLVYHVLGWGMNQTEEYIAAIEEADRERLAFLEQSGSNIDENSVTLDLSPEFVAAGQQIYLQNCGMCHGNQGEGLIGPNLTDEFWLHGGEVGDIFRTIKYGVPEKGMVPWEANLTPVQIAQVSNFILSLEGTNPPSGKAPEGEKKEAGAGEQEEKPESI